MAGSFGDELASGARRGGCDPAVARPRGRRNRILGRHRPRGASQLRSLLTLAGRKRRTGQDCGSRGSRRGSSRDCASGACPSPHELKVGLDGVRIEVDFLWAEERLVVETDGAATHATPPAFARDRRRDQLLVAAGYRVIRIAWEQMADEPEALLARILRILEG